MKILSKIKKIILNIGIIIISLPSKIFAININPMQESYGPSPVPNQVPYEIWTIAKIFMFPLVTIIGLTIYFMTSKSKIKKKILITILIIAILSIIYFVGNKIILALIQ